MYTTKKDKGNPLPADCRKTFVFSENVGVAYCLLCWFCIVQNFWQAIKASLLWGVAPVQVVSHLCHRIVQWLCAADCKHPCLVWGGSPSNIAPARMPGVYAQGLCTMQSQPSIHSLSPGKGAWGFGKDAEIERPKALQGRKAHKAFS